MNRYLVRTIFNALAVLALASTCVIASEGDNISVRYVLEPISYPIEAGPVEMKFSIDIKEEACVRCDCCDHIDMEMITTGGLEYVGPKTWSAQPDEDRSFATSLTVIIPPKDTSSLRIQMQFRGGGHMAAHVYFVTIGDSVEFWKGPPRPSLRTLRDWKPDTAKYEVKIDLRSRRQREYIFSLKNWIGSIEPTKDSGFYIIRCRRDQFNGLTGEGLKCEYLVEPPPYPTGPAGSKIKWKRDTTSHRKQFKRKRDPQIDGSIWLDHIDGVDGSGGRIYANQPFVKPVYTSALAELAAYSANLS